MITKLTVQRAVRERSEQIRLASMQFRKPAKPANVPRVIIPFSEIPDPCYMFETDSDLESFLRHNNLLAALETYLAAKKDLGA